MRESGLVGRMVSIEGLGACLVRAERTVTTDVERVSDGVCFRVSGLALAPGGNYRGWAVSSFTHHRCLRQFGHEGAHGLEFDEGWKVGSCPEWIPRSVSQVQVHAPLRMAQPQAFGMCERCERHGGRAPFGVVVVRSLAAFCEYAGHEGVR